MKIEAYGVKGMESKPWRKTFKSEAAMTRWVEQHDAEVRGWRIPEGEPMPRPGDELPERDFYEGDSPDY